VNTFARAVPTNNVVVANPRKNVTRHVARMTYHIHTLLNGHRLVVADEWAFHEIIALAMTIEASFLPTAIVAHELIECIPDFRTSSAWLK
jgi:hypothetical protein